MICTPGAIGTHWFTSEPGDSKFEGSNSRGIFCGVGDAAECVDSDVGRGVERGVEVTSEGGAAVSSTVSDDPVHAAASTVSDDAIMRDRATARCASMQQMLTR
jgi:hypothetical protein